MQRAIDSIVPTHRLLEGGGFPVRRPAALGRLTDPFLLLDEMGPVDWPPGEAIGAPAHPHRGFETVTYMLEGRMCHEDSGGNSGVLGPGDVQWMTAGRGVVHSELPHPEFLESGGVMHGFQIWVNLPAEKKMMEPRYQDVPADEIPVAESDDGRVRAVVVAGECLGVRAVIDTVIPITYLHVSILPGGSLTQELDSALNGLVFCFGGALKIGCAVNGTENEEANEGGDGEIDGEMVEDGEMAILSKGDEVTFSVPKDAEEGAELLLLAGQPLDEPVARYGPFVMNTEAEIRQAFIDYQSGNFA
uniref:Pirin domain-containing protein n=1 Tax=uncultured marine group II/III euryarchaeote KM3_155_G07 TaxID=1457898 RepID=A0A075GKR6_9EURY|nr:Pirin domain-containing protein [uncultured marine group II/III euryarchaeote KM3_155_G07]